jgi:hypothetical protein
LIIPDERLVDNALADKLKTYMSQGGKILFAKLPEHADLHHSDFLIV